MTHGAEDIPSPEGLALREGFTTGSAATAAAMAALELWLGGTAPACVDVPLPPFGNMGDRDESGEEKDGEPRGFLSIPVERAWLIDADEAHTANAGTIKNHTNGASASVIKDGGDDPDATHGACIVVKVAPDDGAPVGASDGAGNDAGDKASDSPHSMGVSPHSMGVSPRAVGVSPHSMGVSPRIRILGGVGVGRITLPGLPLPVGEFAINPAPRQQIAHGLRLVAARHKYTAPLCVTISVPDGEEIARHTFNGRLGIMGGISILGTQGTVKPYSHAAWKATISQGLDVAVATGCTTLCLSTGRRSEKLLLGLYPHLPPQAAVQVADFAEFSLREAGQRPFSKLVWGCFFGKLVKLAQGHSYTHARSAELDFNLLARWCAEAGTEAECVKAVPQCVTANHALELLFTHEGEEKALRVVCFIAQKAAAMARNFAGTQGSTLRLHVFHLNGKELVRI